LPVGGRHRAPCRGILTGSPALNRGISFHAGLKRSGSARFAPARSGAFCGAVERRGFDRERQGRCGVRPQTSRAVGWGTLCLSFRSLTLEPAPSTVRRCSITAGGFRIRKEAVHSEARDAHRLSRV
jgi:hypothetical protein